jgi:hypothetical protein
MAPLGTAAGNAEDLMLLPSAERSSGMATARGDFGLMSPSAGSRPRRRSGAGSASTADSIFGVIEVPCATMPSRQFVGRLPIL